MSTNRYPTAHELAEDLRRFLSGEPTLVRPLATVERLWKWTRRYPAWAALLGVTALFTVLLICSLLLTNHQIRLERDRASASGKIAHEQTLLARRQNYNTDIRLAQEAWDNSTPEEARELMRRYVPGPGEVDLRGPEWHLLWKWMESQSQIVARQERQIWSLAVSPDGQQFATGDEEGTIRLWSLRTRRLIREFSSGDPHDVNRLLFSPDGESLLSAGQDGVIRLWDAHDGSLLGELKGHQAWVSDFAYCRGGDGLISGDGDGRVVFWDLTTRQVIRELYQHSGAVRSIVVSQHHPLVASFSESADGRVWNFENAVPFEGLREGRLEVPRGGRIRSAAFHEGWALARWIHRDRNTGLGLC